MTLFQFADARFQKLTQELQIEYSVAKDAETKTCMWLIRTQHAFFRWIAVPKIIFQLFLVKAGLTAGPTVIARAKKAPLPEATDAEVPRNQEIH